MKILWFTNTACSASEILFPDHNRGGWLSSLEKELSLFGDVDLHIAFYYHEKLEPFVHNKTHFYPIFRSFNNSKIQRYLKRLLQKESNDRTDLLNLIDIVNNLNPDLIHVHGTEENYGLIQNQVDIPVVISIQGVLSSIVEKFYAGIPRSVATKYENYEKIILLKSSRYGYHLLRRNASREREILKKAKYILGRTEFDRRVTKLLSPRSTYYIANEILRSDFYNEKWEKNSFSAKIQIVSVISNGTFKGYETILKTAQNLVNSGFDFEWKIAGVNKKDATIILTHNWLDIKHNEYNIELLGNLNTTQIVNLFKSADIFCQVSHIENSPNTLCESLIMGVPSIATFAGGTSSILENNKEGILVQDGDSYSFAGAIIEMSNDFNKAKQFGVNARQNSLIRHNKESIVEEMLSVYAEIILEKK